MWYNDIRVHSYALDTAYQWLKHIVYVLYGCENQSEVDISLNHDVMASIGIISTPELTQNPKIGGNLGLCNDIRVHPYALEAAYIYL